MKWYFKVMGGHTHVRVFMNGAKCGDLCFRNEEMNDVAANCPWITFIQESPQDAELGLEPSNRDGQIMSMITELVSLRERVAQLEQHADNIPIGIDQDKAVVPDTLEYWQRLAVFYHSQLKAKGCKS